jgi:hypothetical protein
MLNLFFQNLSRRFSNENDLSDITWVMAESVPVFRLLFIQFFFKEVSDLSKLDIFRREHAEGASRGDFYIKIEGSEFVIECKVMDRNQHFTNYKDQWPKARHGYISNYTIDPQQGFEMRTWEGVLRLFGHESSRGNDRLLKPGTHSGIWFVHQKSLLNH